MTDRNFTLITDIELKIHIKINKIVLNCLIKSKKLIHLKSSSYTNKQFAKKLVIIKINVWSHNREI